MVRIGHASIGSNGSIKNDVAGDQNGKEVCVRSWYNKQWQYLLRCKDSKLAERLAKACEDGCANKYIGYDQNERNTLIKRARECNYDLSKINISCECDCSSFMSVCAECAGIKIPYSGSNAPTTSTMVKAFTSTGMFDVITDPKYLNSDAFVRRGDILVKAGSHTVMVLDNGSNSNDLTVNQSPIYKIGKTYTLQSNLNVRVVPNGERCLFGELTKDGKKNSFDDGGGAVMRKGTRITCKDIQIDKDKKVWIKSPSGWMCAYNGSKAYIL